MSANARNIVELNEMIDRLEGLVATFADHTAEVDVVDGTAGHEDEARDVVEASAIPVEKEIKRKLMEIHSRLKNCANCLNFGDEESFFDDADQDDSGGGGDVGASRVERRRKASQQQQQQRQDEEVDNNESDSTDADSAHPPHPLPMSSVNSAMTASTISSNNMLLTSDRAVLVLKQCLVVFGCERETSGGAKRKLKFTDETKALAAQLVAELARSEPGRRLSLQHGVIAAIGFVLGGGDDHVEAEDHDMEREQNLSNCSLETAVQVCRILGNLCYDCPEGRKQVLQQEASLKKLVELARSRESRTREDPGQRLPVILPGFLLNLCNGTPEAVDIVGKLGYVDVIVSNILSTQTNDAVFNGSLNFLICLSEELESAKGHIIHCKDFPSALTHILEYTTSPEVTQTVLELIRALIDAPDLSLHLAKHTKLFETVLSHIVGKWQTSSEFELLRADACELIVVFLSHDDCMKEIHGVENGKFVSTFADWLDRQDDPSLQVCASLALGNFACNETIGLGLLHDTKAASVDKMIRLLGERQNPASDFKLQHAILGALRNFAVTTSARTALFEKGILPPCLRLINRLKLTSPAYHAVIFKLLGTLRLLVDGHPEVVVQIVEDPSAAADVVATIVSWGLAPEAPQGIRAESGRLLAALLKNSRSKSSLRNIMSGGGLPLVTQMLHSNHVRMYNEALVALTVLTASLVGGDDVNEEDADLVHQHLQIDLVINGIKRCFGSNTNTSFVCPVEVMMNSVTFVENLLKVHTEDFKQMLLDMNFVEECLNDEALKNLPEKCRRLRECLN